MKKCVMWMVAGLCVSAWAGPKVPKIKIEPPNILVIMADDLAYGMVGYQGGVC